jgi:hypothetical protein
MYLLATSINNLVDAQTFEVGAQLSKRDNRDNEQLPQAK